MERRVAFFLRDAMDGAGVEVDFDGPIAGGVQG
jgi:hypothetical protein